MKRNNIIWSFFLALLASCAMGFVVVRVQFLWFLIPEWLASGMARFLGGAPQESSSDVEFLSAWLVCLALIYRITLTWRFAIRTLFAQRKS